MSDELQEIADWASIFSNKTKLISTVSRHYALHRKETKADIAQLRTDMAADQYFAAGEDAATLVTLLIGPIQ